MDTSIVVSYFNDIPVLDVMNVKGYCVEINEKMRTFLFAKDIAINGGLSRIKDRDGRSPGFFKQFNRNDCQLVGSYDGQLVGHHFFEVIRWDTFNKYAYESLQEIIPYDNELQYLTQLPITEYSFIPQEIAYLIIMRCNNAKAREFRAKLSLIVSSITNKSIEIMREKYKRLEEEILNCNNFKNIEVDLSRMGIISGFNKLRDELNNKIDECENEVIDNIEKIKD